MRRVLYPRGPFSRQPLGSKPALTAVSRAGQSPRRKPWTYCAGWWYCAVCAGGTVPVMVTITVMASGGTHKFGFSGSMEEARQLVEAFKSSRDAAERPLLEFTSAEGAHVVFDGFRVDGLSIQDQEQEARKGRLLGGA